MATSHLEMSTRGLKKRNPDKRKQNAFANVDLFEK